MPRKIGSRDKKKRILKRNAFGLTVEDLRKEQKRTKIAMGIGAAIGGGAGALAYHHKYGKFFNTHIKKASDIIDVLKKTKRANTPQYAEILRARNQMRMGNIIAGGGSTITGMGFGAFLAGRGMAAYREKKYAKYRKKYR